MVEEAYAAITHPEAVVVNPHHATVTDLVAVFRTWWHDLAARLAKTEFADLRYLFIVFGEDGSSGFILGDLEKLHVVFVHFNSKLPRGLLMCHLDVAENSSVEALELVMGPCFKV